MSADPALPDDALRISSNVVEGPGEVLVIALHGEVDLLTAPLVSETVTAATARHPTMLIIDLTAVTFLDSSGLSILAQAHTAASAGRQVRVVAPADGMPYRAMALTGLDKILTVFPSRTDALPSPGSAMPTRKSPAGDPGNEGIPGSAARESDASDLYHPAAPANPAQLALLREEIAAWAARAGLHPDRIPGLQLAVYEAMANVVVHAYPGQLGTFSLLARSHDQILTVTVADHGRWQPAARPGLLHGRGLPLIHTLADHATIDKGTEGTSVTMTWSR